METQGRSEKPEATREKRRGLFGRVAEGLRGWLGMYPGCGCKSDVCDAGDPMAQLPNTSPVERREKR